MAAVKSRDGRSTERRLRAVLVSGRVAGWRMQGNDLPGRPDFYFPRKRLAVFVDGCFWHGCVRCYRRPHSSQEYWDSKVKTNAARDRRSRSRLRRMGWRTLRLWEHDVRLTPGRAVDRIRKALAAL